MKTISSTPGEFESTYALIVRLEEKQRSRFEVFVFTLLLAATTLALSQFGRQFAVMPSNIAHVETTSLAHHKV